MLGFMSFGILSEYWVTKNIMPRLLCILKSWKYFCSTVSLNSSKVYTGY